MIRRLMVLAAFAVATAIPAAEKTGFVDKSFKNADGSTSPYVLFVPHGYDGTKPVPTILFLHGSGETKGGAKMPAEVGLGPAIKKREKEFPFLVVIPQSEKRTWLATSDDGKRAIAILDEVAKAYKVDAKKTYLTGLSMGGMGTLSIGSVMPERFAAIVPVCGRMIPPADVEKAAGKLKGTPAWFFHGDKDAAVKVDGSREMVAALKKAGAEPKYTEYPGVPHNCWDLAYGTDELYSWLLKQEKK
jgi:predicted peptidase